MASSISYSSDSSFSYSDGSNCNSLCSNANVQELNDVLHLLSQGVPQVVKIDGRRMLETVMRNLGLTVPPIFSLVPCGAAGVKFSIKLDLSNLSASSGSQINHTFVLGESFHNPIEACDSAIRNAFYYLEKNHRIHVMDFSSRVCNELDSRNSYYLLCECFDSVEHLIVNWDLALDTFMTFAGNIEGKALSNIKLIGPLSDYFTSLHTSLHGKTKNIRESLQEVQLDRLKCERSNRQKCRQILRNHGLPMNVAYPCKIILDFVLYYYGLDSADYSHSPQSNGSVKTTICFQFPYMENFKYGGRLKISCEHLTYSESQEEAAYQALLFIERNFHTTVVDFNYSKRQKVVKSERNLVSALSRALEIGDSVKMMFGEMINGIEMKLQRFSFDPKFLFPGPNACIETEAYVYCCNCLKEWQEEAVRLYMSCSAQFDLLNKISWKTTLLQNHVILD